MQWILWMVVKGSGWPVEDLSSLYFFYSPRCEEYIDPTSALQAKGPIIPVGQPCRLDDSLPLRHLESWANPGLRVFRTQPHWAKNICKCTVPGRWKSRGIDGFTNITSTEKFRTSLLSLWHPPVPPEQQTGPYRSYETGLIAHVWLQPHLDFRKESVSETHLGKHLTRK